MFFDSVATASSTTLDLPDTPLRFNTSPSSHQKLREQQIPLPVIEAAFLLASLRRLMRPPHMPPLSRIRSLAYFQPVIDELLQQPLSESYLQHLRLKLRSVASNPPAAVKRNTIPEDR